LESIFAFDPLGESRERNRLSVDHGDGSRKKGKRRRSLNADLAAEEKKKVIFGQRQVGANYQARSLQEHGFLQRDPVMAGSDALKQREPSFGLVARLLQRTTCIRSTRLEPQTEVYEFVQFLYRKPGYR
jgi:hypothetical protein